MNPLDALQSARKNGYGAGSPPKEEGETGVRSFPLTPEEVEAVGEEATCVKAYGKHDGKIFSVERIEPENENASMGKPPLTFS